MLVCSGCDCTDVCFAVGHSAPAQEGATEQGGAVGAAPGRCETIDEGVGPGAGVGKVQRLGVCGLQLLLELHELLLPVHFEVLVLDEVLLVDAGCACAMQGLVDSKMVQGGKSIGDIRPAACIAYRVLLRACRAESCRVHHWSALHYRSSAATSVMSLSG